MTLTRFEFTHRARPILEVGLGYTDVGDGVGVWDQSLWDAPSSTWNGDEPFWRDVSCDVIEARTTLGRERVSDSFDVGTAEIVVDNRSGWADPSLDFEVDSTVGYMSFPGTAGNYVSVADYPALGVTGDMCVVFRFRTSIWPPVYENGPFAGVFDQWGLAIGVDGQLAFGVFDGGVPVLMGSDPITPSTDWRWYALAFDANNGAGGHSWKWWYGGNGDDPDAWVEYDSGTAAGTVTIDTSSEALFIGAIIDGGFTGDISHLSVRSGTGPSLTVGGTRVFEFDGWRLRVADETAASITSAVAVGPNPMDVNRTGTPSTGVTAAVNPAGPSLLKLRPGRPIRVGVEHATFGKRWRFYGFIDDILPSDSPEDWSTVKLNCVDALGEVGRAKLVSDVEVGAGEQARTRFARILNVDSWPSTKRSISPSAIRPQYAARMDGQVVDLLRQTAESEGGWCFGDDQGRIVLQHRDWLYHVVGAPVDGVIGNVSANVTELLLESGDDLLLEQGDEMLLEATTSDVCPVGWVRSFARSDIATRVILDRDVPSTVVTPPAPVVVDDPAAQILYGVEPYERTDLWTLNTGDVQQIAGRIMATRAASQSLPRIRSVTVDAAAGSDPVKQDAAVDLLAQLSIYTPSRYRCRLNTERGLVFDANFFAVGVTEFISADEWNAEISLDRSRPYEVLDAGDYVWDTARWDRSLWN